jgi:polygalacturonase
LGFPIDAIPASAQLPEEFMERAPIFFRSPIAFSSLAILFLLSNPRIIFGATGDVGDIGLIPNDAGVFNVKNYGAKGDGSTDDTQAIRNALADAWSKVGRDVYIYFPNGTYLVSGPIKQQDSGSRWHAYTSFLGQSQAGAIIKLKDNTFTSEGSCASNATLCANQSVLYQGSECSTLPPYCAVVGPAGAGPATVDGNGGDAFNNYIMYLTVDTGSGNAGAVGIHTMANNAGGLRNVTVRSGPPTIN